MRAAWAVVVAVLVAGCAPVEPPLTCEEQDAVDTAAIEEIWPQGFETSDSTQGACDDSGDELGVNSTAFPAHELPAVVRSLQEQGWTLDRRDAYMATLSRDGDEAREFTAWVDIQGDEASPSVGVDS